MPPINSDMPIAASTSMETFQSDIDDGKEDVQELKNGMQTIQQMLQQLIPPTKKLKTTVSTTIRPDIFDRGNLQGHRCIIRPLRQGTFSDSECWSIGTDED
jgi:hypothetical protein